MAKEPLVIKRMKHLQKIASYVSLSIHDVERVNESQYCLYDNSLREHTYPNTYQELLTDLANRISRAEIINGQ